MKKYLLIILVLALVIALMIGISFVDKVIVIQFVIPKELLPYYEWLISFPGIKTLPATPSPDNTPSFKTFEI